MEAKSETTTTTITITTTTTTTTTTPVDTMQTISKNVVFSLIDSFIRNLSEEQWRLLITGTPDVGTKTLLAGLLLDIIDAVTEELLLNINKDDKAVSQKRVGESLGNTISQTFSDVLQIEEEAQCVSSQRLTDLVVKEVTHAVNSAISSSAESRKKNATLKRLKVMVTHCCHMLKFMTKKKSLPTTQDSQNQTSTDTASPTTAETFSPENVFSNNSFVVATSRAMQQIIRKEVNAATEPLLKDTQYEILSESFLEIDEVADEIARSIVDDVETEEPVSLAPKSKEESKQILKTLGIKVKTFFTKQTSKALLLRLVGQLKDRFYPDSEMDSGKSVQSLIDSIDSLLEEGKDHTNKTGQEVCPYQILENVYSKKVLVFKKELNELLLLHIMDAMSPEVSFTKTGKVTRIRVLPSKASLRTYIDSKVWGFLLLMSYWLKFQSHGQSQRVAHALMNGTLDAISSVIEARRAAKDDRKRRALRMFVSKLVSRTYKKAKMSCMATDPNETIEPLLEKLWSAVKDIDFPPDALKDLDRAAYKKLRKCKKWDCAERLLASLWIGDPDVDKFLIPYVVDILSTPPENPIVRFLYAVGVTVVTAFSTIQGTKLYF